MVKSAGQREQEAADAIRPIFEHGVRELGLRRDGAATLVLRIAEAYARGRADQADMPDPSADHEISAAGIAIVLMFQTRPYSPRAGHPEILDEDRAVLASQQIGSEEPV